MKLTKKLEAEIKALMNDYWDSYLRGDLKYWRHYLVDDYRNIGGTEEEIWNSKKEILDYTKRVIDQMVGMAEIRNKKTQIIPYDPYIMVHEFMDLFIKVEGKWNFYGKFRLSSLIQKINGEWKVLHQHGSYPDSHAEQGEAFALDNLRKENIQLRDAVKRRTIELEEKNNELEIEAALERVRARAMSMQHSDELAELVATVFNELTALGFALTSSIIWIHDHHDATDTLWIASAKANKPAKPFRIQPFHNAFFKSITHAWKARDPKWVYTLKGQPKKTFEKAFFKELPDLPDALRKALLNPKQIAFSASFNNFGALEIVETEALTDKKFDILHRFGKVFDLSYTRFNDLKKAEEQAREAQVELAVERVRANALAMHRSEEIINVVNTLRKELQGLNIPGIAAATICLRQENGKIRLWDITSVVELDDGFHFAMDIVFGLDETKPTDWIRRIWDAKEKYFVYKQDKREFKRTLAWTSKYNPEFANTARRFLETNDIKNSWHPAVPLLYGKLSLDLLQEPVAEVESILIKMGAAFDLAYKRFLDLKNAEAQAREAQIEASLERVRAQAMAMHKSKELTIAAALLFRELNKLGLSPISCGYSIVDEQNSSCTQYEFNEDGSINHNPWTMPLTETEILRTRLETWKKKEPLHVRELRGEQNIFHHRYVAENSPNFPLTTKQFLAGIPDPVVLNTVNFQQGYLIIVTREKLTSQFEKIVTRFGKVFEQTYTRFLDLQKAEAQAREAQIEASLERVRARTMGMHQSKELHDVIETVTNQLLVLGLEFSSANFCRINNDNSWELWLSTPQQTYPSIIHVPYIDHKIFNRLYEKDDFFTDVYDQNEAGIFFHHFFENTIARNAPEERKQLVYNSKGFARSGFRAKDIWFVVSRYDMVPFTHEENSIIKRFAKVFEQSYTRFLDLQKAEAQAREAQIEAGLERVRSRGMAMQTSEELGELIGTLLAELTKLDLVLTRCVVWIIDPKTNDAVWWMANSEDPSHPMNYSIPYHEEPPWLAFINEWKKRTLKWVYDLKGQTKKDWDDHLFSKTGLVKMPNFIRDSMKAPGRVLLSASFNNFGGMNVASLEPLSDEHFNILLRFAKVFDLTYTRFNDLKQAEAQAREAQIELGLERVRARAMAMQRSDELKELIATLSAELGKLDIILDRSFIIIYDTQTMGSTWWMANPETPSEPIGLFVKYHEHASYLAHIEAWKKREIKWEYILEAETKKTWDQFLFVETELSRLPDFVIDNMRSKEKVYLSSSFNNFGYLTLATLEPLTNEQFDIMLRFARVFDLTYTRFNDLKQAEAQTREAQIQLALERVRARTMAMQKSDELQETTLVLFQQFKALGATTAQVSLCIFDEATKMGEMFVTLRGEKIDRSFSMEIEKESFVMKKAKKAFLDKQKNFSETIKGKELQEYNKWRNNLIGKKGWDESDAVRKQAWHVDAVFFSRGMIGISSDTPASDEAIKLLEKFSYVFDLTFTRFLDLKKAEEQARESQIQLALERVRARTMAMQKSNELSETSFVLFQQFKELGSTASQLSIGIFNEKHNVMEMSTTIFGSQLENTINVSLDEPIVMKKMVVAWKEEKRSLVLDVSGDELKRYNEYRNSIGTVKFETKEGDHWVIHVAFFSKGMLSFSSHEPHTNETVLLLERFAAVFDLTYTRFLDLKQAETQAKEARVEAALERVRARSMGMQKSDELTEVVAVLYKQFEELDFGLYQVLVSIYDKKNNIIEWWSRGFGDRELPQRNIIPIIDHPFNNDLLEKWEKGVEYYPHILEGELKQSWDEYLFTQTDLRNFPQEVKDTMRGFDKVYLSDVFMKYGSLQAAGPAPLPDDKAEILKRFVKVLDLAYTRMIDLQNAEAQAKESQIQLALERVRARTMAMQHSEELADTSYVLFQQFNELGGAGDQVSIGIYDEDEKIMKLYSTFQGNQWDRPARIEYSKHPVYNRMFVAWKNQKKLAVTDLTGTELHDFNKFKQTIPGYRVPENELAKDRWVIYTAFFSNGLLSYASHEPKPKESIQLLERFASVFDLTYTRFLDLKKAEAQTREVQIELALERVRARTMAMHRSEELAETAQVMFHQLNELGGAPDRISIGVVDEAAGVVNFWSTDQSGSHINNSFKARLNERTVISKTYEAWKEHKKSLVIDLHGDDLIEWIKFAREEMSIVVKEENIHDRRVHHLAFFSHGWILVTTHEPQSTETIQILERFASVFNLTYRRFLDLQKAEAQARESQIQLALERVRARTMAMQKSNEHTDAAMVMFQQLSDLGVNAFACGFVILDKSETEGEFWMSSEGVFQPPHFIPHLEEPSVRNMYMHWKNKEEFYAEEVGGEALKSHYKYLMALPKSGSNFQGLLDAGITFPEWQRMFAAYFSHGYLLIITKEQYKEENIFIRFAKVFEQTYTRFLDLQKAEANAREAQIEAALEKVRSRSLAMHKSVELQDVVNTVFARLSELDVQMDSANIAIFNEGKRDFEFWLASPVQNKKASFRIGDWPYAIIQDIINAKHSGLDFFSKCFSFEEKNEWFDFAFENTDFRRIPIERRQYIFESNAYALSIAFSKNTGIQINNYSGKLPGEKEIEILKRFSKVFEQAYIRFLDLEKAEGQAREAQIEAALEKVRARTMGMQHSDELPQAANLLFQQIQSLGMPAWSAGYCIWDDDKKSLTAWMSSEGVLQPPFKAPTAEDELFIEMRKGSEDGKALHIVEMGGEKLVAHYKYMRTLPVVGEILDSIIETGHPLPTFQIMHQAYFSKGFLLFITYEPVPDAHDIFKRFATVFDQTYTRFLDLQKAEAQAKEARIEISLERIRARALAMHSSDELMEVARVLREQMALLGQRELESSVVHLYKLDPDHVHSWRAVSIATELKSGFTYGHMAVPINCCEVVREWLENFYSDQQEYTLEVSGTKQQEWYVILEKLAPEVVNSMRQEKSLEEKRYYRFSKFSGGALLMISKQPPSEEAAYLQKRAAVVFDLAYRRFSDLQKAEAQAREAQIEAGLERVRSRTMAMHKSDELAETAVVMFKQLIALGIAPNRLYIGIIKDTSGELEFWITDENGDKMSSRYMVNANKNISLKKMYEGWAEKKKTITIDMQGEEVEAWLTYWKEEFHVPFKPGATLKRRVQNLAYFSKGFVAITSPDYQPAATINLVERFAAVFNLTYTRFSDLQQAEAQAREAQIEAGLERVRARTMAMHSSDDVSTATATMFTELEKLGIENLRCGISTINENKMMEVWSVSNVAEGKTVKGAGIFNMDAHPLWQHLYEGWKNKEELQESYLAGKEKEDYIKVLNANTAYLSQPIQELPDMYREAYYFNGGAVWTYSLQSHPEEHKLILKRFASVFSLTFRRYQDLKKAEAQTREATIEAALEKVRGKAMAMHNSNDLSVTTSMIITELRKLGISPIRCGVGILSKETHQAQLYTATTSAEGDSLSVVGWVMLKGHPVLENIYEKWIAGEDYFPELTGDSMQSYYEQLLAGLSVPLPDFKNQQKHYGHFFAVSVGCLYAWSDVKYNDDEIKILKRFASIIDLTFRRYFELQKSEENAKEAVKQAALDRIRADIASMRSIQDLDRITPLIWNELTILGLPFIRCGVFIMDDSQQFIHTFLSTPDGKAIAAFHLPYDTPGNISKVIGNWRNKKRYVDHWDEEEFIQFAEILMKQGALTSKEQYLKTIPHGGFHLHFLPFLQGMLYVGNTVQLNEGQIELIQHVADAFSTAYARYEDFNRLEAAKQQVENTLTDLKQAQTQLVQSEKMASLGELTAGIAHEIQNPLNFVNNFSDVSNELLEEMKNELEKGNKEDAIAIVEDVKQNLEKILHHGKRADAIVKGMLQHSRTSSGQKEMTDINILADEYLRLAYHGLRAKDKSFNAKFETHFDNNIEKINVIPQDIGRVILNLINNAFYTVTEKKKKNDNGYEPTVTITTQKDNGRIEVKVKDNGNGIPQKNLDKIFQPFFTTKPTGQGTGLGLSLAYDIVTKGHGGELKVETKEGEGSEFVIQLPG